MAGSESCTAAWVGKQDSAVPTMVNASQAIASLLPMQTGIRQLNGT